MSRMTTLREQPHSSLIYVRLASLNGTHRWQQRLVGAALATPATGNGCLCGPCFCGASRRVERGSTLLRLCRMLRLQLSGAANNAIASRATTLPVRRGSQPRTHQEHRDSIASDRILYSRCGPRKVREQFAVRASRRGLPRALPQGKQKLLPREMHARRAPDRLRLRPIGERR